MVAYIYTCLVLEYQIAITLAITIYILLFVVRYTHAATKLCVQNKTIIIAFLMPHQ